MKREDLITQLGLQPAEGADSVTDEQIDAAVARLRSAENENSRLSTQLRAANEAREQAERERGEQSIRAANERRARIEDRLLVAANAGRITEAEKAGWRTRLEGDFDGACTALAGLAPAMNTRTTQKTGGLGERNGGTAAMTRASRIQAANEAVEARLRGHQRRRLWQGIRVGCADRSRNSSRTCRSRRPEGRRLKFKTQPNAANRN